MVYFNDVTTGGQASSSVCITHERPFSQLTGDLTHHRLARYNFITPNVCNDMHDACSPTNDAVKQGDDWLAHTIPGIIGSSAYRQGGVIFVIWDEGEGGDGPIGCLAISSFAKRGYAGSVHYTHSSTLRTLQEIFGVRPLLRSAAKAHDLSALFTLFP
jgi:hypothetical protein